MPLPLLVSTGLPPRPVQGPAVPPTRREAHPLPSSALRSSLSRFHVFTLRILGHVPRLTPGLPSHDCILLIKPKNRWYRLRHSCRRSFTSCVNKVKPCSRELSVSWITPGNCASYWKDQPGHPPEKLGGRTAPTCSRGYPGPQTMPKYRINARREGHLRHPAHTLETPGSCR